MKLRPAVDADLSRIVAVESRAEFAPFINRWPLERHASTMTNADWRYLSFEDEGGWLGYAMLSGLLSPNRAVTLARIALARPGEGRGKAAMHLLLPEVFDRIGAHRLQLDLFVGNERAERLYLSLGFRHEGVLRDAELRPDGFKSLKLMALLEPEYRVLDRLG